MKSRIEILFEDEDIVIIDKPAKVLSIPDRHQPKLKNCKVWLERSRESIFTVHRIDKDTSGVMLFAKNEKAHQHLSLQFQNRTVEKRYKAIVNGSPNKTGTIDAAIAPNPNAAGSMRVHRKGKPSITHYETITSFGLFSLVELRIETGRTHQIRVHMSHIGHPLMIDPMYGGRVAFYLSSVKRNYKLGKFATERPLMDRLTLHAELLRFEHPTTGKTVEFTSPLPKDFRAVISQLEKIK